MSNPTQADLDALRRRVDALSNAADGNRSRIMALEKGVAERDRTRHAYETPAAERDKAIEERDRARDALEAMQRDRDATRAERDQLGRDKVEARKDRDEWKRKAEAADVGAEKWAAVAARVKAELDKVEVDLAAEQSGIAWQRGKEEGATDALAAVAEVLGVEPPGDSDGLTVVMWTRKHREALRADGERAGYDHAVDVAKHVVMDSWKAQDNGADQDFADWLGAVLEQAEQSGDDAGHERGKAEADRPACVLCDDSPATEHWCRACAVAVSESSIAKAKAEGIAEVEALLSDMLAQRAGEVAPQLERAYRYVRDIRSAWWVKGAEATAPAPDPSCDAESDARHYSAGSICTPERCYCAEAEPVPECLCGVTGARHCAVHQEGEPVRGPKTAGGWREGDPICGECCAGGWLVTGHTEQPCAGCGGPVGDHGCVLAEAPAIDAEPVHDILWAARQLEGCPARAVTHPDTDVVWHPGELYAFSREDLARTDWQLAEPSGPPVDATPEKG